MAIRIYLVHPKLGVCGPVEDGITHRPFSWASREAAEAQVKEWTEKRTWNRNPIREPWAYEYKIVDTKEDDLDSLTQPYEVPK